MARKSGLGPLGRASMEATPEFHPIISALQFNAHTKEYGGASMDANTGEVLEVGKTDAVLVGGERDTSGKRIPTTYYGKTRKGATPAPVDLSPSQVMSERRRVKSLTGGRSGAVIGSWVSESEPHKGVQMDASAAITDRSKVLPTLRKRGEEAGFDLLNGTEIKNPYYTSKTKKK